VPQDPRTGRAVHLRVHLHEAERGTVRVGGEQHHRLVALQPLGQVAAAQPGIRRQPVELPVGVEQRRDAIHIGDRRTTYGETHADD
jgi:hypothetical protein